MSQFLKVESAPGTLIEAQRKQVAKRPDDNTVALNQGTLLSPAWHFDAQFARVQFDYRHGRAVTRP